LKFSYAMPCAKKRLSGFGQPIARNGREIPDKSGNVFRSYRNRVMPGRRFGFMFYERDSQKTALPGEAKKRGSRATPSGVGHIKDEI
jgi:hypothetical protein